jgi:hypothetical protein
MSLVTETFDKAEFCKRAPSTVGDWKSELKDCPRFKVIGEHPGFIFCPATTTQGFLSLKEDDLVPTSVTNLPYPVPTLPSYIISATNGRGSNSGKGVSIIDFLVHGVDIDPEWCQKYLVACEEKGRKLVEFYASSEQKRREMGHPKCSGYITSYIADEEQLKFARSIPGRDPTFYISKPSNDRATAISDGKYNEREEASESSSRLLSDDS